MLMATLYDCSMCDCTDYYRHRINNSTRYQITGGLAGYDNRVFECIKNMDFGDVNPESLRYKAMFSIKYEIKNTFSPFAHVTLKRSNDRISNNVT